MGPFIALTPLFPSPKGRGVRGEVAPGAFEVVNEIDSANVKVL